ncbi:hypothetical protein COTS27_01335 [Spirochaetota bacterium]|nr:hypothetical protein COTS27_01335 [Spirochaetota bacterium]
MKRFTVLDYVLFTIPTLIWGTSWLVIKDFQVVDVAVDPMISVGYRFTLAGLLLWVGYFFVTVARKGFVFVGAGDFFMKSTAPVRESSNILPVLNEINDGGSRIAAHREPVTKPINYQIKHRWQQQGFILLQGICLFALNYWLFYEASYYLPSGVIALIFSLITVFNLGNGVLFLKERFRAVLLLPAILGILGLVLVFITELQELRLAKSKLIGLGITLVATYLASLGNILSAYNQRQGIGIFKATAYGMVYGGFIMLGAAWVRGVSFVVPNSMSYLLSLGYLAIFASIIAFYSYLRLIGRVGAERAAYIALVFPIIAIVLSILFEGYVLSSYAFLGILFVLISNVTIFRMHS